MGIREQLMWYDAIDAVRWQIDLTADDAERWFFTEWFYAMCQGWSLGELLVKANKTRGTRLVGRRYMRPRKVTNG